MYVYGGIDKGGVSQQLWAYNFTASLWEEVQLKVKSREKETSPNFSFFFVLISCKGLQLAHNKITLTYLARLILKDFSKECKNAKTNNAKINSAKIFPV